MRWRGSPAWRETWAAVNEARPRRATYALASYVVRPSWVSSATLRGSGAIAGRLETTRRGVKLRAYIKFRCGETSRDRVSLQDPTFVTESSNICTKLAHLCYPHDRGRGRRLPHP